MEGVAIVRPLLFSATLFCSPEPRPLLEAAAAAAAVLILYFMPPFCRLVPGLLPENGPKTDVKSLESRRILQRNLSFSLSRSLIPPLCVSCLSERLPVAFIP